MPSTSSTTRTRIAGATSTDPAHSHPRRSGAGRRGRRALLVGGELPESAEVVDAPAGVPERVLDGREARRAVDDMEEALAVGGGEDVVGPQEHQVVLAV